MDRGEIESAISKICQQFKTDTHIGISDDAESLLKLLFVAIHEDPHPSWRIDDKADSIVDVYKGALPFFLHQIRSTQKVSKKISTFDVVHWLSESFGMLCVIQKTSDRE